jgi:serine/threonine protein kinase
VADEVIGGYRLHKLMGSGLTSQVYEAVEIASGRHFAIKMLLPEAIDKPGARDELLHEAEVGLKLEHKFVIKIVKVEKSSKNPYFVMEFFPAGSLKLRIMHKEEAFLKEHGQFIIKQGATSLAYMNNSGWVHRDVKPENFLVDSAGALRLIDFALAQRISKGGWSLFRKKGPVQGTRTYMSPEQIECKPLDGRADLYSFGATCYEIVTLRPPFRANSTEELFNKHLYEKPVPPQTLNKDVTDQFGDLILKMLAKNRDDRPHNFNQVLIEMQKMRVFRSVIPGKSKREGGGG